MTDLREYKAVVLDALKDLRKKDAERMSDGKGWGWSLRSIGKGKISLRWGYVPDDNISIRVADEEDGEVMLEGRMDDRYPTSIYEDDADDMFVLVGDRHWHDASDVGRGLRLLMENIGYITRTRY